MFGKRKTPGSGGPDGGGDEPHLPGEGESRGPAGTPPARSRPSFEVSRRPFDPAANRRAEARSEARAEAEPAGAGRKLVVGHGIRLAGEIKKCETLVVEGHIEADLNDCASLEINESGEYLGSAVVDAAEISGHFDGSLTVRGRLFLRSSGEVRGTIRYADLEIERGGRIAGDVDVLAPAAESTLPAAAHQPDDRQGGQAASGGELEGGEPQQAAAAGGAGKSGGLI